MKKIYSFSNLTFLQKVVHTARKLSFVLGLILITASAANAVARTASVSGNWNSTLTWGGLSVPVAGDDVTINAGVTVTVTATAACATITFPTNNLTASTVSINSGITLNVSGLITIPRGSTTGTIVNTMAVGAGILNAGSVSFTNGGGTDRHEITISTGTVTVTGNVSETGSTGSATITFTDAGLLQLGGSFLTAATGTLNTATGCTVEYNAAGAQTLGGFTYENLTLSTSGAKNVVTGTTVTVNGTLSRQGTATITTSGSGALAYGPSAVLEYKGSAAQATTSVEFPSPLGADLLINNASGVTINGAKTVNGNINVSTGSLITNNLALSLGNTFGLTVASGATLTGGTTAIGFGTTGSATINGTFQTAVPAGFSGAAGTAISSTNNPTITLGSNSTIEYNAGVAQAITDRDYANLTVSTTAGIKTWTLTATTRTVSGDLTISANAPFTLGGAARTLNLQGDWIQNSTGTFTPGTNIINFNGTAAQSIGGSVSTTFSNVTFNNSLAGLAITVNKGATITGAATFTDGIVSTNTTNFLTFNAGSSAVGVGLSQATDASYVSGPVLKTGNTAFTFPVGSVVTAGTGGYMPITISAPDNVADAFRAEYVRGSATAQGGVTPPLLNVSNCDYWNLNKTNDAGVLTTISVTLSWDNGSPCNSNGFITSLPGLTVAHFTGPNWDVAGTGSATTTGNTTTGTVRRDNVTAFSPFALGNTQSNQNPLPVKMGNITGYEKQSGIQVDWTAYTESNLSHYEIERSTDGKTFATVGQVVALNSMSEAKYGWFDATPITGANFYRIKSVDMDGKTGYSPIVKVNLDKTDKTITIYPNPVQAGHVSFQSSDLAKGNYTVRIYNNNGQQVYTQSFIHNGGALSQTIQLPSNIKAGMYALQLENDGSKVMSKAFMVQ